MLSDFDRHQRRQFDPHPASNLGRNWPRLGFVSHGGGNVGHDGGNVGHNGGNGGHDGGNVDSVGNRTGSEKICNYFILSKNFLKKSRTLISTFKKSLQFSKKHIFEVFNFYINILIKF